MKHPLEDLQPGETREVTFSVTQAHIDAGKPRSCYHCPVALAFRDVFPGSSPFVSPVYIDVLAGDPVTARVAYWAATPELVQAFMMSFDAGDPVGPLDVTAGFTRVL